MVIVMSALSRMTSSTKPPRKPEVKPRIMPTVMPKPAAMKPTISELGAPAMISATMSRPLLSVPSGWAGLPPSPRMFSKPTGGRFSGPRPT